MSQNDFDIANQGFSATRADLNLALKALASNSSGDAAPATPYANQFWYETDTNILHIRNEANSAWLDLMVIDGATGSPSFNSGNVGIGTTSPSTLLDVAGTANATNITRGGSQVYSRNNILATVSQTSGVPTGGIIERGVVTPGNRGQYIRYADGTQICWTYAGGSQVTNDPSGSLFRNSTADTWTFPVAFSEAPVITASTETSVRWVAVGTPTTTTAVFRQYGVVTSSTGVDTRLMAVGRWF